MTDLVTPETLFNYHITDLPDSLRHAAANLIERAVPFDPLSPRFSLRHLLRKDRRNIAMVTPDEEELVGVAAFDAQPQTSSRVINLHYLAVTEEYRRVNGCGSRLLGEVERVAHELGARTVFLQSSQAGEFFAGRGYSTFPTMPDNFFKVVEAPAA